jgi:predicted unusual protein kinase regulating ubiquinone biosynthesis (AarF/ABC1/UbiB family)
MLDRERRIVLLDCGMVGHVQEDLRGHLLELLLALGEGRGSDVARIALRIAEPAGERGADKRNFERVVASLVAREHGSDLTEIQAGRTVLELCGAAARNGVFLPAALTMIGKTLLNLDQIGRLLDPGFDPNAAIRRHGSELMTRSMWRSAAPTKLFATLLDAKELAEKAPGRVNRVLELASQNELSVNVRNDHQESLLVGLQKISNRVTTGILLGSLVIGAGLTMRVETQFELFGYPGLAIIFFLLAAGGSLLLLVDVLVKDRARKRR